MSSRDLRSKCTCTRVNSSKFCVLYIYTCIYLDTSMCVHVHVYVHVHTHIHHDKVHVYIWRYSVIYLNRCTYLESSCACTCARVDAPLNIHICVSGFDVVNV